MLCPQIELSAMRTELGRSHERRHCWLMDRLLFCYCWACCLFSVSDFVVSLRYLLSHLLRGFGFIILDQKWMLNFIKCFFSVYCMNCLHLRVISAGHGQLHICSSTVNTLRVGTVLKVIYSHSSPAKLRPCGEKGNPCVPFSRCSVNTSVGASEWMHIQSLACILGRCSRFLKIWRWAVRGASPPHVH